MERSFDSSKSKAALTLLTHYATPADLRRAGATRVARWLKARGCRNSASVATTAIQAARAQDTALAGEQASSVLVAKLAATILAIDDDLAGIDAQITQALGLHPDGQLLMSMPGFGPNLAATFLAQVGGSLNAFESADKLASLAGLAPVPRDSGRVSGNLHRPRRFNRRLLRTCYLAALSSLKNSPASRAFYDRKRAEGKSHKQALIALARRRMNVIWAMLRDHAPYVEPATALLKTA